MMKREAPGWYAWLAVVGVTILSQGGGWIVSTHAAQRAAENQAEQSAATLRAVCAMVVAQEDVYRETPPSTAAGRNAERAWRDLHELFKC